MKDLLAILEEGRHRERSQALFYRFLAADAETEGDAAAAERLNELLADEQHHVSRLTARVLELGHKPADTEVAAPVIPPLDGWEGVARQRENDEVRWYTEVLQRVEDPATRSILMEILSSERHHKNELAGKWMPAASTDSEGEA
ncbi:MAG TPA: ferritin-like domain-containing protein [Longimicrobiales bacterium]|nr:ferritin-like domain-containing protein [Longimicrobiales bacterium]